MIRDRGGYKSVTCDYCHERDEPLEKHEIVNDGRLFGNEWALRLADEKAISNILCRTCHQASHNRPMQEYLLGLNVWFYARSQGREEAYKYVSSALAAVHAAAGYDLGITMPSQEAVWQMENPLLT